jgi:hypothetical protein
MSPIDERLKSTIVLPDVMPPVVDGYGRHSRRSFVQVTKSISLAGLARSAISSSAGRRTMRLAWIKASSPRATWQSNCWPCLKPPSAISAAFDRIVKLFVVVNGAPNFTEPHRIADGASELLVQVLGERGIHSRSAVGAAQAPFGACVVIDMIAEIEATPLTQGK